MLYFFGKVNNNNNEQWRGSIIQFIKQLIYFTALYKRYFKVVSMFVRFLYYKVTWGKFFKFFFLVKWTSGLILVR